MHEIPELLERFRKGPEVVEAALSGATDAVLDHIPAPGKWSVRQIAAHLADSEIEASMRFRRIITEDNPPIRSYDQDAWAERFHYGKRVPSEALELFRLLRSENYEVLKSISPDSFERKGVHSERGVMTLRQWLEIYAGHAEKHAAQIQRIRQNLGTQQDKIT